MKAVIYARYSSHNQREESIEGQLRVCHEFANEQGFTVVGEYCDRALTGKNDHRPEFLRMIHDSDRHKFQAVIMYTLDRFARNRYDSAMYKAKLKKNGVKLYYATQPMPDTPETIILESLMEGLAEYYSENLARGVKRGMKENALAGISVGGSGLCLGYKIGANRKYEIEPTGAKAVQTIFEMYAGGKRPYEIVNYLNEHGYKTKRGRAFNKNSLPLILHNKRYLGIYKYADMEIEGGVPAIISQELFDKVQARLKHNARSRASGKAQEEYLLTGKLFCGHCGKLMVGEAGTSRSGAVYHYYKCNSRKYGRKCEKKTECKDWIENLIVKYTVGKVLTDSVIDEVATKVEEIVTKEFNDHTVLNSLREQLKINQAGIKNIMNAIEQGIITPTTKDRLTELEAEGKELEIAIAKEEIKKPLVTKEHVVYYLRSFKGGDITDRDYCRNVIDALVNSVFLYDNDNGGRKIVVTYNFSNAPNRTIKCSDIEGGGRTISSVHKEFDL